MVNRSGYVHQSTLEGTLLTPPQVTLILMVSIHQNSTVDNWVYLADYDNQVLHIGSHLACFYGGNWILGALRMVVVCD